MDTQDFSHFVADTEEQVVSALRSGKALSGGVRGSNSLYAVVMPKASPNGRLPGVREVQRQDAHGMKVLATWRVEE